MENLVIRDAEPQDGEAIAAIYNDAVRHTTAVFSTVEVDGDNRRAWRADRVAQGFPVLVVSLGGEVLGYASYGPFRSFPGYLHTAELSIYIAPGQRGKGLGAALLGALIARAKAGALHVLVAGIEASNEASIALHARQGFEKAAVLPQVGQKFGRWLDLLFMSLRLNDDAHPPA